MGCLTETKDYKIIGIIINEYLQLCESFNPLSIELTDLMNFKQSRTLQKCQNDRYMNNVQLEYVDIKCEISESDSSDLSNKERVNENINVCDNPVIKSEEIIVKEECIYESSNADINEEVIIKDELNNESSDPDFDNTNDTNPTKTKIPKRYTCPECKKSYQYIYQLKRHNRVHTGERPYECQICHKSFTNAGNLCTHKRVHSGIRPHGCDQCGKKFTTSYSLQTHIRIHTNEKPFKCDVCLKPFSDYSHLLKHKAVHTRDKPFHCKFCEYKCKRTDSLKMHLRLHTGERPFRCNFCGRCFTVSSHLTRHIKSVHKYKYENEVKPFINCVETEDSSPKLVPMYELINK